MGVGRPAGTVTVRSGGIGPLAGAGRDGAVGANRAAGADFAGVGTGAAVAAVRVMLDATSSTRGSIAPTARPDAQVLEAVRAEPGEGGACSGGDASCRAAGMYADGSGGGMSEGRVTGGVAGGGGVGTGGGLGGAGGGGVARGVSVLRTAPLMPQRLGEWGSLGRTTRLPRSWGQGARPPAPRVERSRRCRTHRGFPKQPPAPCRRRRPRGLPD